MHKCASNSLTGKNTLILLLGLAFGIICTFILVGSDKPAPSLGHCAPLSNSSYNGDDGNGDGDGREKWTIDFEHPYGQGVPLVFVTGANSAYFDSMRNIVSSFQFWSPGSKIVVYDIGLKAEQVKEAKTWRHVDFRKVPFDKLPAHFRDPHKYAWKPWSIADAMKDYKRVFWVDAGCEVRNRLDYVDHLIRRDGYLFVFQTELKKTHPAMLQKIGFDPRLFEAPYKSWWPMIAGGIIGFSDDSPSYHKVLLPSVKCAMEEQCIAPKGSSLANHRYDQSVLSLYAIKENYRCDMNWTFYGDFDDPKHVAVTDEIVFAGRKRHRKSYTPFIALSSGQDEEEPWRGTECSHNMLRSYHIANRLLKWTNNFKGSCSSLKDKVEYLTSIQSRMQDPRKTEECANAKDIFIELTALQGNAYKCFK